MRCSSASSSSSTRWMRAECRDHGMEFPGLRGHGARDEMAPQARCGDAISHGLRKARLSQVVVTVVNVTPGSTKPAVVRSGGSLSPLDQLLLPSAAYKTDLAVHSRHCYVVARTNCVRPRIPNLK